MPEKIEEIYHKQAAIHKSRSNNDLLNSNNQYIESSNQYKLLKDK